VVATAVAIGLIAIAARRILPSPRDRQIAIVFTPIGLSGTLPMSSARSRPDII
jgi:hypothetical protein